MTTIAPTVLPIAPSYLTPDWRFANNDWSGSNALTYIVWSVEPVYAADGVTIITAGEPRDLTGCSVSGAISYQRQATRFSPQVRIATTIPTGDIVGDPTQGVISLSLPASATGFGRQEFCAWGDPTRSLLIAEPMVRDTSGALVTIGLQPVFVF
jgi:hypothetical protein